MTAQQTGPAYVLGHGSAEMVRLDRQAQSLAIPTRVLLTAAGIRPGMRVLDIGTGTGEVAFLVAELVGESGAVVAIDRSGQALAYAEHKRVERGIPNVHFNAVDLGVLESGADVAGGPFDAVVGRLVLPYLPDAVATIRVLASLLVPGGVYVAMEFDINAIRSDPPTPLAARLGRLIADTFDVVGTPMTMGPHLSPILREAGLADPRVVGLARYTDADDQAGLALVRGVVSTLMPAIERHGLGTAAELDVDTIEVRLANELHRHDATLIQPILVGGWATRT